jgi:prepilin-type N-terminal cleavage/methylation domain-containing protein
MNQSRGKRRAAVSGRGAFTLVELLVVIAIIAVLMSLTVAAAMRVLGAGPRTQTLAEINKLTESLKTAQRGGFGSRTVDFFPSKLVLYEDVTQYTNGAAPPAGCTAQDVQRSAKVLTQMFGSRVLIPGNQIPWSGAAVSGKVFVLEGNQALVFYLGGIPNPTANQTLGFTNDPANPANIGKGSPIGPFFQFEPSRLRREANGFFSYLDPYGSPYAYFANYAPNAYQDTDCAGLGLIPYKVSATQYVNPDTFQIVSAGPDKKFGPGGTVWSPQSGTGDDATRDNLTNFSRSHLASAQ